MATKTLIAAEEFLPIFEAKDGWCELVEGEVAEVSPGAFQHNRVRDTLLILLRAFAESHKLGIVVSEQPFRLAVDIVRFPDIAFVTAGRDLTSSAFPEGAPDLAIEVISPSNTPREMDQKISHYFAAGCKRVWVVYPEQREIYIHGMAGVTRRRGEDALEEPELLSGFSVKASSLFE